MITRSLYALLVVSADGALSVSFSKATAGALSARKLAGLSIVCVIIKTLNCRLDHLVFHVAFLIVRLCIV